MSSADPRTVWRQFSVTQRQQSNPGFDMSVAIAGSFTVDPLEPYLGAHLLNKKLKPHFTVGPFNQLRQICDDYRAVLGDSKLDVIVLLWRIEDLFPDMLVHCLNDPTALTDLKSELKRLSESIAQLRKTFDGILIVSTPPYPSVPGFEVSDTRQAFSGMAVFSALSQFWTESIGSIERVGLFDLHALILNMGLKHAQDTRKWMIYRQPYTEPFWLEIGRMVGRMIASEKFSPKKCVVLDLDNTLWGGIIGEDGLGGIQLGDEFPGKAYRDFQRYLLHLKGKGVLLAVASRNNPDDAYEVFDKHDAMVLSRKDIAAFEIHWDSKVDSIQRVARTLNIGVDSLVFVDDNPKEIGEVAERLPGVTCVIVPEELAYLPGLLSDTDLFDFSQITEEDRRRTEMIAAESLRKQTQDVMSEDEFRRSLNLRVKVFQAETHHLARVTQLINKTNQFNLTTVRRTQDEVEAMAKSRNVMVLGMDIVDRYGDYGLVGVSILKKEGTVCVIDTLLMSCRVLGRGAENAFLAKLVEAANALGCEELFGTYIPTAKNGMVKDLYKGLGFTSGSQEGQWVLRTAEGYPRVPSDVGVELHLR